MKINTTSISVPYGYYIAVFAPYIMESHHVTQHNGCCATITPMYNNTLRLHPYVKKMVVVTGFKPVSLASGNRFTVDLLHQFGYTTTKIWWAW